MWGKCILIKISLIIEQQSDTPLTCNANNAKTIKQNIVNVITSANCLKECNNALIIVLSPVRIREVQ